MSTPEVITVNSEALEAQVRDLLPSQNGFGSELQASNVIMPIIDLTATAEGSGLSESLQTALAFGSQTAFAVAGSSATIISSAGFWRIYGQFSGFDTTSGNGELELEITDGLSVKKIWSILNTNNNNDYTSQLLDLVVFVRAGDSVSITTSSSNNRAFGSVRQLATVTGELINPAGFVAE